MQHLFRLAEEFPGDKSRWDFGAFPDSYFLCILPEVSQAGMQLLSRRKDESFFASFFLAKNRSKSYNLLNFQAGFNEELGTKLEIDSSSE